MSRKTSKRKLKHLEIMSEEEVQAKAKTTLFENVEFVHQPIHEINAEDIDLSTELFGKKLNYPILISGMTGGHKSATKINKNLAKAAQKTGVAMGLGSQRAMLENKKLAETYQVRDVAPDILLIGNLGVPQLKEFGVKGVKKAFESIEADVFAVHLNNLQEIIQVEGDTNATSYLEEIEKVVKGTKFPIIIKETGAGISKEAVKKLIDIEITGLDIGGAGGTSWSAVEIIRDKQEALEEFWDWGIPTAASILEVRSVSGKIPLISSGGLRTGMDIAKSIALGADIGGLAYPFFKAAEKSSDAVVKEIENLAETLKNVLFLVGAENIEELKEAETVLYGKLLDWKNSRNLKRKEF